ncbi:hypothetical protein BJY52DRAFT_1290476 [Lactarius psammicola]|nr:hypothetical protein BJY52DRAFT_1290476 [Lactarius psammicola]
MTPLSRVSGKFNLVATHHNRLTSDIVDTPKPASDNTVPSTSAAIVTGTATASTSNAIAPSTAPVPPRNPLATQLVSFFFDTVQRLFKVPTTVDLSYGGFEVSFATDSIQWVNAFHDALFKMRDQDAEDAEDRRVFELMPAPANATLHRYIKDLARVRIDLAALQIGEGKGEEDPAVEQLLLRVKGEQETVQSWIRRVCEAAGALSIADPAFSPRK